MTAPSKSLRKSVLPYLPGSSPEPGPAPTSEPPSEAEEPSPASPTDEEAGSPLPMPASPGGSFLASQGLSAADLADSFTPSEQQLRVRAKFWARLAQTPLAASTPLTLALAKQLTQSAALDTWARRGGFKEWFFNERALEERLDWLLVLALQAAEEVLQNADPKAQGARVAMVKTVVEMAKLAGAKSPAAGKGEAIGKMNKEELEKLLASQGITVQKVVSMPLDPKTQEPAK